MFDEQQDAFFQATAALAKPMSLEEEEASLKRKA